MNAKCSSIFMYKIDISGIIALGFTINVMGKLK